MGGQPLDGVLIAGTVDPVPVFLRITLVVVQLLRGELAGAEAVREGTLRRTRARQETM